MQVKNQFKRKKKEKKKEKKYAKFERPSSSSVCQKGNFLVKSENISYLPWICAKVKTSGIIYVYIHLFIYLFNNLTKVSTW